MVTITKPGKGKCLWCQKENDGVQAKFADLTGFLCWKHLREAVDARAEKEVEGVAQKAG